MIPSACCPATVRTWTYGSGVVEFATGVAVAEPSAPARSASLAAALLFAGRVPGQPQAGARRPRRPRSTRLVRRHARCACRYSSPSSAWALAGAPRGVTRLLRSASSCSVGQGRLLAIRRPSALAVRSAEARARRAPSSPRRARRTARPAAAITTQATRLAPTRPVEIGPVSRDARTEPMMATPRVAPTWRLVDATAAATPGLLARHPGHRGCS